MVYVKYLKQKQLKQIRQRILKMKMNQCQSEIYIKIQFFYHALVTHQKAIKKCGNISQMIIKALV